jgi:hypothetical protein
MQDTPCVVEATFDEKEAAHEYEPLQDPVQFQNRIAAHMRTMWEEYLAKE